MSLLPPSLLQYLNADAAVIFTVFSVGSLILDLMIDVKSLCLHIILNGTKAMYAFGMKMEDRRKILK